MIEIGDVVWAKLRGYPWWPAKIVSSEKLPKALRIPDNDCFPVYFFGSKDFALIGKDSIKEFSAENWKLLKTKSSAPKFKIALAEARKEKNKIEPRHSAGSDEPKLVISKKRGRPRKLKLPEARMRLQKLLFTCDVSLKEEVLAVLIQINKLNEFEKSECKSSKLGILLKKVFCSNEFAVWHDQEDMLRLVQETATKIIKSNLFNHTIRKVIEMPSNTHVNLNGWIKTVRKQKRYCFAELFDGTTSKPLQLVIPSNLVVDSADFCSGSSVSVNGKIVESEGSMQNRELLVDNYTILGRTLDEFYPIQKINNSSDFIRNNALQFRLRTEHNSRIARAKSLLGSFLTQILDQNEFINIFPPIITEHDCEGGGEAFAIEANNPNFFSKPAYLTVSTQLHLEMAVSSLPRVYSFSPVFRAENQHTTKHLSEFWMLECEVAFVNNPQVLMSFIEYLIKTSLRCVIDHDPDLIPKSDILLQSFEPQFSKISYTDALKELSCHAKKFSNSLVWGKDLQTEHERFLAEEIFKGPVFITDYPSGVKPFYMKTNSDEKTAMCFDLLFPDVGEVVGGSIREDDYNLLKMKMENRLGITGNDHSLRWYLDLRKYGSTTHGGFGIGFDRILQYFTRENNIRNVVMVPRYAGSIKF